MLTTKNDGGIFAAIKEFRVGGVYLDSNESVWVIVSKIINPGDMLSEHINYNMVEVSGLLPGVLDSQSRTVSFYTSAGPQLRDISWRVVDDTAIILVLAISMAEKTAEFRRRGGTEFAAFKYKTRLATRATLAIALVDDLNARQ